MPPPTSNPPTPTHPIHLTAQKIHSLPQESFPPSTPGGDSILTWKTLISSPKTPSNALTAGIATCPAKGSGYLACHRHAQPEIYHFAKGRGVVSVGGKEMVVGAGDVVFIPGGMEHGVRCLGEGDGEDLVWLYVFAVDGFGEVVYRFGDSDGEGETGGEKV